MVRKSGEKMTEHKQGLFGGDGEIVVQSILNQEAEMYHKGRAFAHTVVNPGCSIGFHLHQKESETYYILRGKAEFNDNGTLVELAPGDVAHTPSGQGHGLRCLGSEPLEVIALILFE